MTLNIGSNKHDKFRIYFKEDFKEDNKARLKENLFHQ